MIDSGYTLRDYFANHPEIKVDPTFLNKVCGLPRFKVPTPPPSVENPIQVAGATDWKATAESLQDQLHDVATNAAATLNEYGARLLMLEGTNRIEVQRTEAYATQLKKAAVQLDTILTELHSARPAPL